MLEISPQTDKEASETTYIKIIMNRASLGDIESVFAELKTSGRGVIIGDVPGKDIIVDKQQFTGKTFTGRLTVKVLQKLPDCDLVEVELKPKEFRKLRVDRKTHEVLPLKEVSVYFE